MTTSFQSQPEFEFFSKDFVMHMFFVSVKNNKSKYVETLQK